MTKNQIVQSLGIKKMARNAISFDRNTIRTNLVLLESLECVVLESLGCHPVRVVNFSLLRFLGNGRINVCIQSVA